MHQIASEKNIKFFSGEGQYPIRKGHRSQHPIPRGLDL